MELLKPSTGTRALKGAERARRSRRRRKEKGKAVTWEADSGEATLMALGFSGVREASAEPSLPPSFQPVYLRISCGEDTRQGSQSVQRFWRFDVSSVVDIEVYFGDVLLRLGEVLVADVGFHVLSMVWGGIGLEDLSVQNGVPTVQREQEEYQVGWSQSGLVGV